MVVMQTAEAPSVVALAHADLLVDSIEVGVGRRHSGDLAPKLAELMSKNRVQPGDVEGVAVSRGPGGYTGLRVGLASALALTLVTQAKLVAIPTLEGMAWQCPAEWKTVRMVADALRGKAFVQEFKRVGEVWQPTSPLDLVEWEFLATSYAQGDAAPLAGPGYRQAFERGLVFSEQAPRVPSTLGLLRAARQRLANGMADDPTDVDILYGQPSSAEEQWKKLHPESKVN
jgi:tRNA threonylcarbamoyladenosine biosynthesis protein TsaB